MRNNHNSNLQGNEYCQKALEVSSEEESEELEAVREFQKICRTWVFTPVINVRRSRKIESRQTPRPITSVTTP